MKKSMICLAAFAICFAGFAQQVGIGITSANSAAILEVADSIRGLLIPRIKLQATNMFAPITGTPAAGNNSLLVYNTATQGIAPNEVKPGFYYWNQTGSTWQRLNDSARSPAGWSLTGNAGTNAAIHFIGTADDQPLRFKVNGTHAGMLWGAGETYLGMEAGSNASGLANNGFGAYALTASSGILNNAAGYKALSANTSGEKNTAVGHEVLQANTTGNGNTATGFQALMNNTDGYENTALGAYAMQSTARGFKNAAAGAHAMRSMVTGIGNTAAGYQCLYNTCSRSLNDFLGSYNTAVGIKTMLRNKLGGNNVALGAYALGFMEFGNSNTIVGSYADVSQAMFISASTALGTGAVVNASDKMQIGNPDVTLILGQRPFMVASDQGFKYDVKEDVPGLGLIMQITPVTYKLNNKAYGAHILKHMPAAMRGQYMKHGYDSLNGFVHSGFMAQQVARVCKQLGYDFDAVHTPDPDNDTDTYSLCYPMFTVPVAKAIQEQQALIQQLKDQQTALQNAHREVEQAIRRMKDALDGLHKKN